jgi:exodeoxyribonuclease V alpha subunit
VQKNVSKTGINLSIVAEFRRFLFQRDDFSVMSVRVVDIVEHGFKDVKDCPSAGGTITCVGAFPQGFFYDGVRHIMTGNWTSNKYGMQLKVEKISAVEPHGKEEIVKFLSSGLIKGIGPVTARRIADYFGSNTLEVLDSNPRSILQVKGIGQITAEKIMASWKEQRSIADLITTLCSYGLTVTYAKKALKAFGTEALNKIRENPYILTEIKGVGFLKADAIAKELGIKDTHPARLTAGVMYCLDNATYKEGHSFLPEKELVARASELMQLSGGVVADHFYENDFKDLVFAQGCVYLKRVYHAEKYVADRIEGMAQEKSMIKKGTIEKVIGEAGNLTDEQRASVKSSLSKRISVLTGLPGTGKTYSLLSLIRILETLGISYAIAAPTGKAAKRVAEVTGKEAKTIHRLLDVSYDGTSIKFRRNESNPLSVGFVIIDEMSMTDILLMESLLKAIRGSCLVLVGDFNQLPSVGTGRILKDLVEHKLCTVNVLAQIQRQAADSNIVKAAHCIHNGESIHHLLGSGDLVFIPEDDPAYIRDRIVEAVSSQAYAPMEKTQVLSPMKKGEVGTKQLNAALRDVMRNHSLSSLKSNRLVTKLLAESKGQLGGFLRGDKVIQMENNYEKEVFNGEIGHVVNIDEEERKASILFDDRIIVYEDFELDQLDYAYALTVHKYQGSEIPCVIMPVTTQHYVMLYRNLIYTAITRAREKLVLVGSEKALAMAIKNNKQILRYSGLGRARA